MPKRTKSFRLSEDAIQTLKKAARRSGLSEAEIVEACLVAQVETLVPNGDQETVLAKRRRTP